MGPTAGIALADSEVDRVLAPLAAYPAVLLAVSGGPDSMALMHFVAEWRARRGRNCPRICVATVDHGLRAESPDEAAFVARAAAALGLEHRTLHWKGPKPSTGIPALARAARYSLLECEALAFAGGPDVALATAHTLDDQAETFLMRLKRGSGVDGLSAMAPEGLSHGSSLVTLLRPLLSVPKSRLFVSLETRGVRWIEDPTNTNLDFERPRIRRLLDDLALHGQSRAAVATSARRLRAARDAVTYAEQHFRTTLDLTDHDGIYESLNRSAFAAGPALLRERVLAQLIGHFGGETPDPELSEVEGLVARLAAEGRVRATLGGAVVSAGPRHVRVWRESGRLAALALTIAEPGVRLLWDSRFWVRTSLTGRPVAVRALGEDGRRAILAALDPAKPLPAGAVAALPSFWAGDQLIGVPQLKPYLKADTRLPAPLPQDISGAGMVEVMPVRVAD